MKKNEDFNLSASFSDSQLADIVLLKAQGLEWEDIREKFNKRHKGNRTLDALKHAYRKYGNFFESDSDAVKVAHLKEIQRVKRSNSKTARENKTLLDYLNIKDKIMEDVEEVVKKINKPLVRNFAKPKPNKTKRNMTLELLLSDLHYGKETETFNLEVARNRMRELCRVLLAELHRALPFYNVHRIILALIGDIIESATMHNLESAKGCEFGNPRQVQVAIESLFFDLILPVSQEAAKYGIKIDVPAVTGNHDREDERKTFVNPGEENLTWVIYNTLEMLCKQSGLKNVQFYIPVGAYVVIPIYANLVLYEHGDNANNLNRDTLERIMNKRQSQIKRIVDFFRIGHFHEPTSYGRGRIMVNGSLTGQDSYSEILGFDATPNQILNFYVETEDRPTCFYRSFPIYLK